MDEPTAIEQTAAATGDERIVTIREDVIRPDTGDPATPAISVVTINEGVPTQVANPKRASWRTFVQSLIPLIIAINAAVPIIYGFLIDPKVAPQLEGILGPVYGWLVLGFNGAAILLSGASKLIALLMANPRVNEWISSHKLTSWLAPIKPPTPLPSIG